MWYIMWHVAPHRIRCHCSNPPSGTRTAKKSRHLIVREVGISVLPDLLANNLNLVIVGTAAGRVSANRQLYYAGLGQSLLAHATRSRPHAGRTTAGRLL